MALIIRLPFSLLLVLDQGKSMDFYCSLDSPYLLATYAFLAALCSYECLSALELVHWEFFVSRPSECLHTFSITAARSHNENCRPWASVHHSHLPFLLTYSKNDNNLFPTYIVIVPLFTWTNCCCIHRFSCFAVDFK